MGFPQNSDLTVTQLMTASYCRGPNNYVYDHTVRYFQKRENDTGNYDGPCPTFLINPYITPVSISFPMFLHFVLHHWHAKPQTLY